MTYQYVTKPRAPSMHKGPCSSLPPHSSLGNLSLFLQDPEGTPPQTPSPAHKIKSGVSEPEREMLILAPAAEDAWEDGQLSQHIAKNWELQIFV